MSEEEPANQRLRAAFAAPAEKAEPSGDCPGDEPIWAAARGELPPDRVKRLLDHSLNCAACAESFRMAAALASEVSRTMAGEERAVRTVTPLLRRRRTILVAVGAVAAVLLLMVTLPMLTRRQGSPPAASLHERVRTALWRVGADRDETLAGGETTRPGDRLYLTLESDVPVHLYLVNRDRTGETTVLFPVAGAQWSNPLRPGPSYRLPGDTSWEYDSWEVSSAGDQESFLVIVSRRPLERLESALALHEPASPRGPDAFLRGGGATTSSPERLALLSVVLEELTATSASGEDLFVREIVLQNPR